MLLRPKEPFDLTRTLRFILSPPALLNNRRFDPLLDYFVDGEYRRVTDVAGQKVLYGVSEERRGSRSMLRIRTLAGPAGAETESAIASLVRRQFSTDTDLGPFYRMAQSDPALARLTTHFRGMRIPQTATVYEALISAILEQQVNLSFAHQVKKALIETYGDGVEFEGRRYSSFPEAAALAVRTPKEFRRLQISGPKARYIIGVSRAALDGSLDLEGLRSLEPAAAQERLLEHRGVGPWTVHYVGLRALGHLDGLPAGDIGLQKAIKHFYGLRKHPSPARVEKLARKWAGWRSYATFYLWLTYWEEAAWKEELIKELRMERRGKRS